MHFYFECTKGQLIETEARLSLYQDRETGDIRFAVRNVKKEPEFDKPFMGHEFSAQDRKNLLETGNLGRQVELVKQNGETFLAYISIDPQTNDLIPMRADRLKIPTMISGVQLNEEQHQALTEGKAVTIPNLVNKQGGLYEATLQVNAEKKGIEFSYNGVANLAEKYAREKSEILAYRGVPRNVAGVQLTDQQKEALLDGQYIYVEGMKRKDGKEFSSWVGLNKDGGAPFKFSKWNPNQPKESAIVAEAKAIKDDTTKLEKSAQQQVQKQGGGLKI